MAVTGLLVFLLAVFSHQAFGFSYDYTIIIPAGKKECYYQPMTDTSGSSSVEFEYQVLDQSPVNFQVKAPNNVYIVSDIRRSQNTHTLHLREIGIYEVCILNRYSNEPKTVYLGIYSDTPDPSWPFNLNDQLERESDIAGELMEMSKVEIIKSIDSMISAADKMRFLQQSIRMSNVKDFIVQRANFSRVNWFSATQLFVMVSAGIVQVVTIRKLFGSQSASSHNMKLAT